MNGKKSGIGAEKVALACSSILGLSLGMGAVTPAHAALIITPFAGSATTAYNSGSPVAFGPSWDPTGFTAQQTFDPGSQEFITLTANSGNGVAVIPGCIAIMGCTLQTFAPGSQVDGTANFQASGSFKINGSIFDASGDYYFGLSDGALASGPDYGWLEITVDNHSVTLDRFAFQDDASPAALPAAVPEPATLSLFAVGGAAVLAARRRRKRMQDAA